MTSNIFQLEEIRLTKKSNNQSHMNFDRSIKDCHNKNMKKERGMKKKIR